MKRFLHLWLAALLVLGGVALLLWQKVTTRRLQHELAARREAVRDLPRLRGENQRLRERLAASDDAAAIERMKAEIARLRQEIATLEQKRRSTPPRVRPPVQSTTDSAAEKDVVRVADFKNRGQATPGAAFQTLVWAVAKDERAALKSLLHLTPAGWEKLRIIWSELPEESRARFKEPEQIVTMLLALDVLDEEGFRVGEETPQASGEVLLRVSRFKHGSLQGEKRIPMRRGTAGWQIMIPDEAIQTLPQAIAAASLHVAPPATR